MVGNNQALIIIDGVRSNNETLNAQGTGTAGTAQSNRLMDLNSEDIENISVLKGAAATAVAANARSTPRRVMPDDLKLLMFLRCPVARFCGALAACTFPRCTLCLPCFGMFSNPVTDEKQGDYENRQKSAHLP